MHCTKSNKMKVFGVIACLCTFLMLADCRIAVLRNPQMTLFRPSQVPPPPDSHPLDMNHQNLMLRQNGIFSNFPVNPFSFNGIRNFFQRLPNVQNLNREVRTLANQVAMLYESHVNLLKDYSNFKIGNLL